MLSDFLTKNGIKSQAKYVEYGYGQVEPNHLSAQRTAQVYAQLPADANIEVLEQGQFVKYDYATGLVNFTGKGEWMLVYNEIKLYRDHQIDCEFAMVKDNYQARIYSPFGFGLDAKGNATVDTVWDRQSRYYNGKDSAGNTSSDTFFPTYAKTTDTTVDSSKTYYTLTDGTYTKVESPEDSAIATYYVLTHYDDVTAAPDMYEPHYNEDPFHIEGPYKPQRMPEGTTMVPRVFKTNVGDIYTTNTINETSLAVGDILTPGESDGILTKTGAEDATMQWQVVKVYTMPDHQRGVKLMRIA
jgi:hypothetical protein